MLRKGLGLVFIQKPIRDINVVIKQDQGLIMVDQSKVDREIYSGALTFSLYCADNSEDPGNCTQQQMMNGASDRNHLSFQPLLLLLLLCDRSTISVLPLPA